MEAEAALKDAQAGATVIGATLQTTQTTASVYDASIAEIEIRLTKLEKDRQTIPEPGEEKRCHPHSIGTDRNRICSYPQEVGSRETTTESCLVGCERSVTSP